MVDEDKQQQQLVAEERGEGVRETGAEAGAIVPQGQWQGQGQGQGQGGMSGEDAGVIEHGGPRS